MISDYKDIDFVYITCGDLYFMDIIEKLVISLGNVSSRKVIVYGINCKVPFDYPNLIKREFISPVKTSHDKWFWKQRTCIEALNEEFENFVWMDGDIIANINIDTISNSFRIIENYPIGDVHIHDEQVYYSSDGQIQKMGQNICEHFGYPRKVIPKDLHACFFIFNKKCKWFFEEILNLFNSIYNDELYDKLLQWNDESLHNFMFSKYGFSKTLPLSNVSLLCEHSKYVSNPKLLMIFYSYWNENSPNNFGNIWGWNYIPEDKDQILYFHENKNLHVADEMIEFLKMKKNNSFNSSKWFFIQKYKMFNFEKDRSNVQLNEQYDDCKNFEYREFLNIESNDVILDVGANIGFFERYCYLKNASTIICFEKSKQNFELLQLNAHKNTILFNADISDIVDEYMIEDENDVNINTYSIDYLFDNKIIDKIDFLKVDNKGKEQIILKGINNSNLSKIRKISIKWYDFESLPQKHDIVNFYLKNGFNCWVMLEKNLARVYLYKQ